MYQTILSEIRKSILPLELGDDVWKIIYDMLNVKHPIAIIIDNYLYNFEEALYIYDDDIEYDNDDDEWNGYRIYKSCFRQFNSHFKCRFQQDCGYDDQFVHNRLKNNLYVDNSINNIKTMIKNYTECRINIKYNDRPEWIGCYEWEQIKSYPYCIKDAGFEKYLNNAIKLNLFDDTVAENMYQMRMDNNCH